jgi:hypothetical protein
MGKCLLDNDFDRFQVGLQVLEKALLSTANLKKQSNRQFSTNTSPLPYLLINNNSMRPLSVEQK